MQRVTGRRSQRGARYGRRIPPIAAALVLAIAANVGPAAPGEAASPAAEPGTIVTGSPDVAVGTHPVARAGDQTTTGSPVVSGSPDVFINGKPAVTSGTPTRCNGVVVGSSPNVFVNGQPLAGVGDPVSGCTTK